MKGQIHPRSANALTAMAVSTATRDQLRRSGVRIARERESRGVDPVERRHSVGPSCEWTVDIPSWAAAVLRVIEDCPARYRILRAMADDQQLVDAYEVAQWDANEWTAIQPIARSLGLDLRYPAHGYVAP